MKCFFLFILITTFYSCIYKAGNRQSDINQRYNVSISPYYIKKYIKNIDPFYEDRILITSEIVNYPENFIPITDSVNGYKYVIEFHSLDSNSYMESHYINLASVYDFKKQKWVKNRDSINDGEDEKFKIFFLDSILKKTVNKFKGVVPDSLLFVEKSHIITIKELK